MYSFIPHEWKRVSLSSLSSRVRRRNLVGNKNVLTISAVDGLVNQKEFFNKYVSSENLSNYFLLERGEFAYNKSYSIGYPVGVVRRLKRYEEGVLSPLYICFNVDSDEIDNRFAECFFDSQWFIDEVNQIAKEGARNHGLLNVGVTDFFEIEVVLPPITEQQKIASILTSVDEVIERTEAQIGKLQDLKKGMMQELLTKGISHTEFKDSPIGRIPKEWDVTTYNSVLTKIDSGWSPNCIELPPDIGEWGVLKVSAVTRDRFIELESKTLPRALEPRESIRVTRDDILLTRANGVAELVGKCVKVAQEPKRKLMMSDKILRLSPNKRIYSEFLLHIFNSQLTRTQIEQSWGGSSGQKNISQANIKSFLLPLPSLKEQQAMGDTLSSIDNSVDSKLLKLKHHIALKNALMQDLLTGKVRVSVN